MKYQPVVVVPATKIPVETPATPKRIGEILLEKADELYPECAEEIRERVQSGQVRISH